MAYKGMIYQFALVRDARKECVSLVKTVPFLQKTADIGRNGAHLSTYNRRNYHTFRLSDEEELYVFAKMKELGYHSISAFIRDAMITPTPSGSSSQPSLH